MAMADPVRPPNRRKAAAEARRLAVLDAALEEFAERGYAGARLDNVAARAGVAKGTIYLVCKDKQDLFQQVALGAVTPVLEQLRSASAGAASPPELFAALFRFFRSEVLGTQRKLIVQLILKEAGHFPEIAEFHYREFIAKALPLLGETVARAQRQGALRSQAYARFPQLVAAPLLFALVWDSLFGKIAPLDVEALLAAHHEALFGADTTGKR